MEKRIILIMQPSKDIQISLNGQEKLVIRKDQRIINAQDMYTMLSYTRGDHYSIEEINDGNIDTPVLHFFSSLLSDVTNRLNYLSESENVDEEELITDSQIPVEVLEVPDDYKSDDLPF